LANKLRFGNCEKNRQDQKIIFCDNSEIPRFAKLCSMIASLPLGSVCQNDRFSDFLKKSWTAVEIFFLSLRGFSMRVF